MSDEIWGDDLLNVKARGETFTNLIKSIDDSKVISIEAGFGRGKTFFREAWAKHLEAAGEVVIQIDAQKSDHSGDPVVTFIGALMEQLPPKERSAWIRAWGTGKKLLWGGTKLAATVVARKAGEEAMEALEGKLAADGNKSLVDDLVTQFGKDASKSLSAQVTAQLSAERVRQNEMPAQLAELRDALTKDKETNRVVILIDELDRCHPDYVIALLEAMKLVFDQDGYVFCLMVNSDYLQRMAEHRFGKLEDGWEYLEKFVDIRLSLGAADEVIGEAARALVLEKLDIVGVPFGEGPEFTVERAAEVAAQMAPLSGLSMRQIKRVLLKVEVALRCYQKVPLDLPLLVWLAFAGRSREDQMYENILTRSKLRPGLKERYSRSETLQQRERVFAEGRRFFEENCPELGELPQDRYRIPKGDDLHPWSQAVHFMSEFYFPEHVALLESILPIDPTSQ